MKLEDVKEAYEHFSGKASDIVRQLSLGGLALIWLFHAGNDKTLTLDKTLLRAAFCISVALACDFLQYVLSASIWFLYFRHKEKRGVKLTNEITAPVSLTVPGWVLFGLKSVAVLIAYAGYIVPFLLQKFAS